MSRKKNRKEPTAGPDQDALAPDRVSKPAAAFSRRHALFAGAALALASVLVAVLSALPGYEDPNRSFNECHKRMGRISTALMQWAQKHGGTFPGALGDLAGEDLPKGAEKILACPESGKEYRYLGAGLEFNFCDRAVVLACPEGITHRYVFRESGREPAEVALYLGADLRVHAQHPSSTGSDRSVSVAAAMERRLEEQALVLSLAAAGVAPNSARQLHAITLDPARLDETRALAAWATGKSRDQGARRALQACLAASRQYVNGVGVSAAAALLRQGDFGGVDYLISALDGENWSWRDAASAALMEKFSTSSPPIPATRPYLRGSAKPGSDAELSAWWAKWRSANG